MKSDLTMKAFTFLEILIPQIDKKMIFITQCDSPALWQTYLSDPASISMEGILIFNKHL